MMVLYAVTQEALSSVKTCAKNDVT